jgi:hypothetical protein
MTHPAIPTRQRPRSAILARPRRSAPAAPPALWAQLDTIQQQHIAALLAELIRRLATPPQPHEGRSDDHD